MTNTPDTERDAHLKQVEGSLRYILAQAKANHHGLNHIVAANTEKALTHLAKYKEA